MKKNRMLTSINVNIKSLGPLENQFFDSSFKVMNSSTPVTDRWRLDLSESSVFVSLGVPSKEYHLATGINKVAVKRLEEFNLLPQVLKNIHTYRANFSSTQKLDGFSFILVYFVATKKSGDNDEIAQDLRRLSWIKVFSLKNLNKNEWITKTLNCSTIKPNEFNPNAFKIGYFESVKSPKNEIEYLPECLIRNLSLSSQSVASVFGNAIKNLNKVNQPLVQIPSDSKNDEATLYYHTNDSSHSYIFTFPRTRVELTQPPKGSNFDKRKELHTPDVDFSDNNGAAAAAEDPQKRPAHCELSDNEDEELLEELLKEPPPPLLYFN